jgi:hypothetical protein
MWTCLFVDCINNFSTGIFGVDSKFNARYGRTREFHVDDNLPITCTDIALNWACWIEKGTNQSLSCDGKGEAPPQPEVCLWLR